MGVPDGAAITTKASAGQSGNWVVDPQDFTVAASGGDMTGAQLDNALANGNVTLESSNGAGAGTGNINVDDAVQWNANPLTLSAANNVNINAVMTAGGTAALVLNPGTANGADAAVAGGTVNVALTGNGFAGAVNFTGTGNSLVIDGVRYTLIGTPGALQGMKQSDHYALASDLDMGGVDFKTMDFYGQGFSGVLDGLGHTINNLTINSGAFDSYTALFSQITGSSVVRNVGMVNETVSDDSFLGQPDTGGIVGNTAGTLSNVYVTGAVQSENVSPRVVSRAPAMA